MSDFLPAGVSAGTETLSACVLAEPIFGPDGVQWHGMAFAGGETVNDITGSDRTQVLNDCLCALASAGVETRAIAHGQTAWHRVQRETPDKDALAHERDRYREALEAIRSWCPNQPTGHVADDTFSLIISKVRIALDGMSREDWNDIANGRDA